MWKTRHQCDFIEIILLYNIFLINKATVRWGNTAVQVFIMNDVMTSNVCVFEVLVCVCVCVCVCFIFQVNRRCATGQVRLAASRECVSPSLHSCNITCGPHGGTLDVEMGM